MAFDPPLAFRAAKPVGSRPVAAEYGRDARGPLYALHEEVLWMREICAERGLTQEQAAAALGITVEQLTGIDRGSLVLSDADWTRVLTVLEMAGG